MDWWKDLWRALGTKPEHAWPDGVIHHGFRVVLLVGLVLLMQVLFPVAAVPDFPQFERGDVPPQDVIADARFTIPKSEGELEAEREQAAQTVAPIFRYDPAAEDTMVARVRRFFAHIDSAVARPETDLERREDVRTLLMAYGFQVSAASLDMLLERQNRMLLQQSLERAIRTELPLGVVAPADYEDSPNPVWLIVQEGTERLVPRDSVHREIHVMNRAATNLPPASPAGMTEFQRLSIILFIEGSYKLDRVATEMAREQARQAVPENRGEVARGERVVAAHEQIREREIERLNAYREHLIATGQLGDGSRAPAVGMFILNLLVLSLFGGLLYFYRAQVYRNVRHVLLLTALIAATAAAAAVVGGTGSPAELVPVAVPALVVAALWDGRMALNLALVLAALLALQAPFGSMTSRVLLLMGGGAAALSVRVVNRRAQGLVLGVVIALVYALTAIGLGLLRGHEATDVLTGIMWGAANGMASALIAMGFLPVFESWTRITTDQTLLELADLNRPLLKRLSLEASGTYAHSINVANLAEAAARAVDANPLLVRVGAYYHDVGKIKMPQYFIENQARGRNAHDQLDPRRSAQIVKAHVHEGVKLAEQAKLPDSVRMFIPEHHGTHVIAFFYDQAKKANPDAEIDRSQFSYDGPKPQSKETAILMVADSVESAAKVLQDPTPENIRALVDRIMDGKIAENQLDEAPLTMRDITRIKEQFTTVLTGMYHHRIDYPPARLADGGAARGDGSGLDGTGGGGTGGSGSDGTGGAHAPVDNRITDPTAAGGRG
ncbi:MAG TPA: HDIG domain-containing protein [Longimicrobiales bacterium]|nr:HDIG domain-containing protein [Longimicrobiales bacterium]